VEKACWRDVTAEDAAAAMSLSEPSADASATAEDAADCAADWIDGASEARSESEDCRAPESMEVGTRLVRASSWLDREARSSLCAYVKAAMPATMAVEKRMLFTV